MKLEKIDVSKERKTVSKIIKVNDANKGRVSRTTLTERNEIKTERNERKKSRNRSNRRKKIFFKDISLSE